MAVMEPDRTEVLRRLRELDRKYVLVRPTKEGVVDPEMQPPDGFEQISRSLLARLRERDVA